MSNTKISKTAIAHHASIDSQYIQACFSADGKHRYSLYLPFREPRGQQILCIIGQNPSHANQHHADKTLAYFEHYLYSQHPQFKAFYMVNLYSRIDTQKRYQRGLNTRHSADYIKQAIDASHAVLMAYGAKAKDKAYHFQQQAKRLKPWLANIPCYKLDIGEPTHYPPHPGNRNIVYRRYQLRLLPFAV